MGKQDKDQWNIPGRLGALRPQPLVEIAGCGRVLIECHQGVQEYSREAILVKVAYGRIQIIGSGLELACMTREQLVICGSIDSVRLLRRD